jgi:hypothetical protein
VISRRHAVKRRQNQKWVGYPDFGKKKLQNSTFDNLLPAIWLSLIWLKSKVDSEKSVKTHLTKFSVRFLDRLSRTVDHNSVFVEDIEVKGMKIFSNRKLPDASQVILGSDSQSHLKRRAETFVILKNFFDKDFKVEEVSESKNIQLMGLGAIQKSTCFDPF